MVMDAPILSARGAAKEADMSQNSSSEGPWRDDIDIDLARGTEVGDYVVADLLARGGCGAVYHARHRRFGTRGAVKVLHAKLAAQPKMVERFLREIEIVDRLRHPHIVAIREFGVLPDARPFFVMEYLDGGTLDDRVRARGRLTAEEALAVLDPVCEALAAAHAEGVVHRDVKASNIAFDGPARAVKLLDFGIAKLLSPDGGTGGLTTVGRQVGTPTIMAPEQLRGEPVDARADVYALGVLLYRLLTGRTPFEATSPSTLARKHLEEPAPRPSQVTPVSPAVDAVVLRCLEKRPERRFDSTRSFAAALADALGLRLDGAASAPGRPTPGVAIYVELELDTAEDNLDDALSRDLQFVLDRVEERLVREGFMLAQATGSGILGVRPVRGSEHTRARQEALALAITLHQELERRRTRDPRVHATLVVHAAEVLIREAGNPKLMGGALIRTSSWAPPGGRAGVMATAAAMRGIEGFPEVTLLDGG
jgi:serine/threonine-protein kinase